MIIRNVALVGPTAKILSLFLLFAAAQAIAVTNTVTSTDDSGVGTLRTTLATAASGDTLVFAAGLSGQTILLTSGLIVITNSINIDASSLPGGIQISGNHSSRIFQVNSGINVVLNSLRVIDGYDANFCGGIRNEGGMLTVNNSTLANNSSPNGAGFWNNGALIVNNSTIVNNSGGGFFSFGGGIYNSGTLTVNNSTLVNNSSSYGGGIFNDGSAATLTVNNSTIVNNNSIAAGGGIYNNGMLNITNSIVCNNTAAAGSNIYLSSYTGANNLVDVNALLAPLGNYGGPTMTMPPLPGSPAINAGSATSLTSDQRGFARLVGTQVDIGAVEGVFNPTIALTSIGRLGNGALQFGFTNLSGPSYTVIASTNVIAPLNTWSNLGTAIENLAGIFQFTDPNATNYSQRFYRVTTP